MHLGENGPSRTLLGYDGFSRLGSVKHDLDAAGTSRDYTQTQATGRRRCPMTATAT